MIKKYLLLSLFMGIVSLNAKEIDINYQVNFGILGELGISHASLKTKGNHYTISISAKATGVARVLSQNREEIHTSKGFIKDGKYYSKMYSMEVEYGDKRREVVYHINYKKKRVTKITKKYKDRQIVSQKKQILDFFSSNDLLTLYFNLPKLITKKSKSGRYVFHAVGAEKQKGEVEIYLPDTNEVKRYADTLGKGEYLYLQATVYQKIFSSTKGELMLAIGKDGIAQKAVLKDLILFGDLTATRIE